MTFWEGDKISILRAEKQPSVILFGNHLALILASFWPVNHLVTTKNWVKMGLVASNYIKPHQRKKLGKQRFSELFEPIW